VIGQMLGHCRVVAKIGEGGMGIVFRAWQAASDGRPGSCPDNQRASGSHWRGRWHRRNRGDNFDRRRGSASAGHRFLGP
jgi:hypothetical protein